MRSGCGDSGEDTGNSSRIRNRFRSDSKTYVRFTA